MSKNTDTTDPAMRCAEWLREHMVPGATSMTLDELADKIAQLTGCRELLAKAEALITVWEQRHMDDRHWSDELVRTFGGLSRAVKHATRAKESG